MATFSHTIGVDASNIWCFFWHQCPGRGSGRIVVMALLFGWGGRMLLGYFIREWLGLDERQPTERRALPPLVCAVTLQVLRIEGMGDLKLIGLSWRYESAPIRGELRRTVVLTSGSTTLTIQDVGPNVWTSFEAFLVQARRMAIERQGAGVAEVPAALRERHNLRE